MPRLPDEARHARKLLQKSAMLYSRVSKSPKVSDIVLLYQQQIDASNLALANILSVEPNPRSKLEDVVNEVLTGEHGLARLVSATLRRALEEELFGHTEHRSAICAIMRTQIALASVWQQRHATYFQIKVADAMAEGTA